MKPLQVSADWRETNVTFNTLAKWLVVSSSTLKTIGRLTLSAFSDWLYFSTVDNAIKLSVPYITTSDQINFMTGRIAGGGFFTRAKWLWHWPVRSNAVGGNSRADAVIDFATYTATVLFNRLDNPQNCPFPLGRYGAPFNTWFLGPTRVNPSNGISMSSVVFAGLTNVAKRQTRRQTTLLVSVAIDCYFCDPA